MGGITMNEDLREKLKAAIKDQLMSLEKEQLADMLVGYCLSVGLPYFIDNGCNQPLKETGDDGFVRNPIDSSASPLRYKLRDEGI